MHQAEGAPERRNVAGAVTLVTAAGAIAVIEITLAISLAALVFPSELGAALPRATGAFILGGSIAALVIGARSSFRGMMSGTQDTAAVVAAVMVAAAAPTVAADQRVATLLVLVAVTSLATGAALAAVGLLGIGRMVRYIPSPVINGFMAGTGWLLLRGGLDVLVDEPVGLDDLDTFFGWDQAQFWLPGMALALLIAVGSNRGWHPIFVSVALVGSVVIFYLVMLGFSSLDQVEEAGWLLGPFDADASWRPLTSEATDADWGAIGRQATSIAAIALVSAVGLLLNMSALEAVTGDDIDLDNELRTAGASNLLGGLAGSTPAYHLLGNTLLARSLGATGRASSVLVGIIGLAALVLGIGAVGQIPRIVAGGMLGSLGMNLLWQWAQNLPLRKTGDRSVELVVLGVVGILGILEGVAVGVVLAAGIFVMGYSRINPVRSVLSREARKSHVDRTPAAEETLTRHGRAIAIVELEGYLFFGSATRIGETLRPLTAGGPEPVTHLILDASRVSGIDSSAIEWFGRSLNGDRSDLTVVMCGVGDRFSGLAELADMVTDDIDHALEYCEGEVLRRHHVETPEDTPAVVLDFLAVLPTVSLQPGDTVFRSGEAADDLYWVEAGELSIWFEDDGSAPMRIRRVGPGAIIGELGFITGEARSATVRADTPVSLHRLTRDDFDRLRRDAPDLAIEVGTTLLHSVAHRLAATNRTVQALMR